MSFTALGALQPEKKKLWLKDSLRAFRESSALTKYTGTGPDSIIQLITKPVASEKGLRVGFGLVEDMRGNGVTGDNEMIGREEQLQASWVEIKVDQLRNGATSKGRKEDAGSVFDFRSEARDKLAFWRAKMIDELTILTASSISYAYNTDGSRRQSNGQDDLTNLDFADQSNGPSSRRHFIVDGSGKLVGNTSNTQITTASVLTYEVLVDLKAQARSRGVKPIRANGKEFHLLLLHPMAHAQLKKDPAYQRAVEFGLERGSDNPIFTGATVTMDGLIIATSNRVFHTSGAPTGLKWGDGTVNGTRSLLLGAQSIGMADLWDQARWDEEVRDAGNRSVIAISMMIGLVKPQFRSYFDQDTVQDFGVMALDHYMAAA